MAASPRVVAYRSPASEPPSPRKLTEIGVKTLVADVGVVAVVAVVTAEPVALVAVAGARWCPTAKMPNDTPAVRASVLTHDAIARLRLVARDPLYAMSRF